MSETNAARWLKWTPEPGQRVTLRTGGSADERREVALDELLLTISEDTMVDPVVQLSFEVDFETFSWMQRERWFNIPVDFTEHAKIPFAAGHPVSMVVATAPLMRGGYPLGAFFIGADDDDDKLKMVLAPMLDAELERPINNPLLYEVVRISQPGDDGVGPGFDRDIIEAWEQGL